MLNNHKELDPVFYGRNAALMRDFPYRPCGEHCFRYHWHDRMELILVKTGSIKINFGIKTFTIGSKSVVIIPPGRLHGAVAGEGGVAFQSVMFDVAMFFNQTPAAETFLRPILRSKVNFEFFSTHPMLVQAMEELFSEVDSADPTAAMFVSAAIYKLIALLYKHCLVSQEMGAAKSDGNGFGAVLTYVEEHLEDDLSLNRLAQLFGYSHEHLCRKFKETTGLNTTRYIRLLRLEKSKKLLQENKLPVGAIATACGFSDFSYFCRCFKATYGITPSEYLSLQHNH